MYYDKLTLFSKRINSVIFIKQIRESQLLKILYYLNFCTCDTVRENVFLKFFYFFLLTHDQINRKTMGYNLKEFVLLSDLQIAAKIYDRV